MWTWWIAIRVEDRLVLPAAVMGHEDASVLLAPPTVVLVGTTARRSIWGSDLPDRQPESGERWGYLREALIK